ncbi:MAG: dTDP-4-amino-4,6-dideoxygalactose transaminase [Chitinophagaceae bacterium]|nr:dTDP-4-amino-4,6-dideoxygalactose transaminase [Oligoflexus sp.]
MKIPLNRSETTTADEAAVLTSLRSGHQHGDGPFTKSCEKWFEENLGCARALLTNSGTDALEMAMLLAGIEPGDEVIMPSFTFVSTANAVALRGATPVFVDIRRDTLNIDEDLIESAITSKTKAIVPVHYAGIGCAMDRINAIAAKHNLQVIEDAAHASVANYGGKPLGSLGRMAAFSFHQTKNLSCGEGGALIVNDPGLIERAEILREKGTNRKAFARGEVDKYTWIDIGSSYLIPDFVSALLSSKLHRSRAITAARLRIFDRYNASLERFAYKGLLQLPHVPLDCQGNAHIFYMILPSPDIRDALQKALARDRIQASSHYIPLHSAPGAAGRTRVSGRMVVTDRVADTILRLPVYESLSFAEQSFVIEKVEAFFDGLTQSRMVSNRERELEMMP